MPTLIIGEVIILSINAVESDEHQDRTFDGVRMSRALRCVWEQLWLNTSSPPPSIQ